MASSPYFKSLDNSDWKVGGTGAMKKEERESLTSAYRFQLLGDKK